MQKLLLLSIVLVTIGVPMRAALDRNAVRSLKKAFVVIVVLNVAYLLALLFVYPHLL